MPTDTTQAAAEALTSHRLAVLRFESGTARRLVGVYDTALRSILAELTAVNAGLRRGGTVSYERRSRLIAMSNELRTVLVDLNAAANATLDERAAAVAEAERRFGASTLSRTIGVGFHGLVDAQVTAALATSIGGVVRSGRIAADLIAVESAIQEAVAVALAEGASVPRATQLVAQVGIVETYRNRWVAMARTEIQRVANAVALSTYAANEDVVDRVQVLATLDTSTCPVCGAQHDKVYPLSGGRPIGLDRIPPFHPRCRCILAPVVRPLAALGLPDTPKNQARYTGNAARVSSFEAWLRTRPAAEVDEVFGSTRGVAWRAGRVTLEQLVSGLRTLSLAELRQRYEKV